MPDPADLTDRRFGRLIAVYPQPRGYSRHGPAWVCICDCGTETTVLAGNLTKGLTQSCGCKRREWAAKLARRFNGKRRKQHA